MTSGLPRRFIGTVSDTSFTRAVSLASRPPVRAEFHPLGAIGTDGRITRAEQGWDGSAAPERVRYDEDMRRRITQHELRNDSGRVLAALAAGQDRLQRTEATFEPLPVDANVARAFGRIYASVTVSGRKARGRRAMDLLTAATALAGQVPLYTRNLREFDGLGDLVEVVPL